MYMKGREREREGESLARISEAVAVTGHLTRSAPANIKGPMNQNNPLI